MTAVAQPTVSAPRGAAIAALIWLALAAIAGASGFLAQLPFPGPQLIILGLTAAAIIAAFTVLRTWLESVPLRWLVGINALRFIGIVFLVLAAQGRLNPIFAARAGWGDIAVALGAVVLFFVSERRLLLSWNVLGFLDLVVAVGTATVVTGVEPLLTFPLSLVPTFAVPLLLANHVFIFRRLLRDAR